MKSSSRVLGIVVLSILVAATVFAQAGGYLKVTAAAANIRAAADPAGQVLAVVRAGAVLEMLGQQGDWYVVKVPAGEAAEGQTGYILKVLVQIVGGRPAQPVSPPPAQPIAPAAGPSVVSEAGLPQTGNPFAGFSLKFGWLASPSTQSFSDAWILSVGYDFALGSNFAAGVEIQPAYRSYSDIQLTVIPVRGWFHLKAGANLGSLLKFLKFADGFVGLGGGGEFTYASAGTDAGTLSQSQFRFGFQGLLGTVIHVGTIRLLIEYQLSRIFDPDVKPNFWGQHVLLGIQF